MFSFSRKQYSPWHKWLTPSQNKQSSPEAMLDALGQVAQKPTSRLTRQFDFPVTALQFAHISVDDVCEKGMKEVWYARRRCQAC